MPFLPNCLLTDCGSKIISRKTAKQTPYAKRKNIFNFLNVKTGALDKLHVLSARRYSCRLGRDPSAFSCRVALLIDSVNVESSGRTKEVPPSKKGSPVAASVSQYLPVEACKSVDPNARANLHSLVAVFLINSSYEFTMTGPLVVSCP